MVSALRRMLSNGKERNETSDIEEWTREQIGRYSECEWNMDIAKQCPKWMPLLSRLHDVNDLTSLLGSLETGEQVKKWNQFSISVHFQQEILYTSYLYPLLFYPKFNYIFICTFNNLSWVYTIHICFLGIPKPMSANLASLLFCACGNIGLVMVWWKWNFLDHKFKM